jgi:hypothetical protein
MKTALQGTAVHEAARIKLQAGQRELTEDVDWAAVGSMNSVWFHE